MTQIPPTEGEILLMDDRYTGFSPNDPKESRPYVVIRTVARRVRVVPQSTRGNRGVYVPDDVVDGLDPGWFVPWSGTVSVSYALSRTTIGYLPRRHLDAVIDQWRKRKT